MSQINVDPLSTQSPASFPQAKSRDLKMPEMKEIEKKKKTHVLLRNTEILLQ